MAEWDTYCQLCSVSLEIRRIRTAEEPISAAWSGFGEYVDNNPHEINFNELCAPCRAPGCIDLPRANESRKEHLAGPGCHSTKGYAGSRISVAEMQGCRACKAIVKKDQFQVMGWQDEDDDELWERDTAYFMTAIGEGGADHEELIVFNSTRHGIDAVQVRNDVNLSGDGGCGIAVHPACWEIFKLVSQKRSGFVDVHGLWEYYAFHQKDDINTFRHRAVKTGLQTWWAHEPGAEWLVANPVDIPGFDSLVKSRELRLGQPVKTMASIMHPTIREPYQAWISDHGRNDPFEPFPLELRYMVLEHLSSQDIANARLVFLSFHNIPQGVFRRLICEDMPWLWEIHTLQDGLVNWSQLYQSAKYEWVGLKGFQNRIRIWKEIDHIMGIIQRLRAEGSIRGVTGLET